MPGHKNHLGKPEDLMPLRKSADILTTLVNMSLVLRLPREMPLSGSCSNAPRLRLCLEMLQNPRVLLTFDEVQNPRKTTSEPNFQKSSEHMVLLTF